MASHRIIKREMTFLVFSEIYLRFDSPKARRKAFQILEAAIQCLSTKGFGDLTFEMIAREAGISRPLVKYYFKSLVEVKDTAMKYIRLIFQRLAVDAMSSSAGADEMLAKYVDACFAWSDVFKTHSIVWYRFLNTCSSDKKGRALNTLAVQAGRDRIAQLIESGNRQGVFRCQDAAAAAFGIQFVISGAVLAHATEDYSDTRALKEITKQTVWALAGAASSRA